MHIIIALVVTLLSPPVSRVDFSHPYEHTKPRVANIQYAEAAADSPEGVEDRAKAIRITGLRCRNIRLGAFNPDRWKWQVEAVSRCSYRRADHRERNGPQLTVALFTLQREACGEEGQETDAWCFYWHKEPATAATDGRRSIG